MSIPSTALLVQHDEDDEEEGEGEKKVEKVYGYKLDFHFNTNDFFTNSVLSKTYYLPNFYDEIGSYPILKACEGMYV